MKRIFVLVGVAACAQGRSPSLGADAQEHEEAGVPHDSGETFADAPQMHDAAPLPPDACVPVAAEKLLNPAFDLAPTGVSWMQVPLANLPGGPYPIVTSDGFAASSAPNKAWLGGAAGGDANPPVATISDQLFQDFAVPASATQIVVTGLAAGGTTDVPNVVFDSFSLDITETNGFPLENVMTMNNTNVVGAFAAFSKTISAAGLAQMVGKTVRLRATSTNDDSFHTNFFLDNLSVKVTACP
jgi:hypothetical protein